MFISLSFCLVLILEVVAGGEMGIKFTLTGRTHFGVAEHISGTCLKIKTIQRTSGGNTEITSGFQLRTSELVLRYLSSVGILVDAAIGNQNANGTTQEDWTLITITKVELVDNNNTLSFTYQTYKYCHYYFTLDGYTYVGSASTGSVAQGSSFFKISTAENASLNSNLSFRDLKAVSKDANSTSLKNLRVAPISSADTKCNPEATDWIPVYLNEKLPFGESPFQLNYSPPLLEIVMCKVVSPNNIGPPTVVDLSAFVYIRTKETNKLSHVTVFNKWNDELTLHLTDASGKPYTMETLRYSDQKVQILLEIGNFWWRLQIEKYLLGRNYPFTAVIVEKMKWILKTTYEKKCYYGYVLPSYSGTEMMKICYEVNMDNRQNEMPALHMYTNGPSASQSGTARIYAKYENKVINPGKMLTQDMFKDSAVAIDTQPQKGFDAEKLIWAPILITRVYPVSVTAIIVFDKILSNPQIISQSPVDTKPLETGPSTRPTLLNRVRNWLKSL